MRLITLRRKNRVRDLVVPRRTYDWLMAHTEKTLRVQGFLPHTSLVWLRADGCVAVITKDVYATCGYKASRCFVIEYHYEAL